MTKVLYRYDGYESVFCSEYEVIKETECGCWIDDYGRKRFILRDAGKQYACVSKEKALESYKYRKKRQIKILKAQLDKAKIGLSRAENGLVDTTKGLPYLLDELK